MIKLTNPAQETFLEGKTAHGLATITAISQWTTDIPLQLLSLYWWANPASTTRGSLLAMMNALGCAVRTTIFIGTDLFSGYESTKDGAPWQKALYFFSNGRLSRMPSFFSY